MRFGLLPIMAQIYMTDLKHKNNTIGTSEFDIFRKMCIRAQLYPMNHSSTTKWWL